MRGRVQLTWQMNLPHGGRENMMVLKLSIGLRHDLNFITPTSPKPPTICNRLSRKGPGALLPPTHKLTLGSRFVCLFFSHLQLAGASRWVGLSGRSGAGLHTITILWLITSHFHAQDLSRSPIFSFKIDRFYLHFYPAFISP